MDNDRIQSSNQRGQTSPLPYGLEQWLYDEHAFDDSFDVKVVIQMVSEYSSKPAGGKKTFLTILESMLQDNKEASDKIIASTRPVTQTELESKHQRLQPIARTVSTLTYVTEAINHLNNIEQTSRIWKDTHKSLPGIDIVLVEAGNGYFYTYSDEINDDIGICAQLLDDDRTSAQFMPLNPKEADFFKKLAAEQGKDAATVYLESMGEEQEIEPNRAIHH